MQLKYGREDFASSLPRLILFVNLTLLEPQSRFGDNLGQTTWNLTGVSPKRDWSSKGVNTINNVLMETVLFLIVNTIHTRYVIPGMHITPTYKSAY